MYLRVQAGEDILDEIVGHGPRRRHFLDFQRDGIRLVDAYPDGQHRVTANVLQNHDGHVGNRVHHEPANFHLHFHHRDPLGIADCRFLIVE